MQACTPGSKSRKEHLVSGQGRGGSEGKIRWREGTAMHQRHAERKTRAYSSRSATVRDESGQPCTTITVQHQRWRRHFTTILDIRRHYKVEELERAGQRPFRSQMGDLPTMEELLQAVGKLKNGKAGGGSGIILPEMVKSACCECDFLDLPLDQVHTSWKEQRVPKEWLDAVIVPIPKKGNLTNCTNWRGIALLNVVGIVAARIIQDCKTLQRRFYQNPNAVSRKGAVVPT